MVKFEKIKEDAMNINSVANSGYYVPPVKPNVENNQAPQKQQPAHAENLEPKKAEKTETGEEKGFSVYA
jgi:hypothetical protein